MATVINGFVWTRRCLKCLKSKRIEDFELTKAEYWCTVCYVSNKPFLEKNMNVAGGLLNRNASSQGQKYSEVISAAEAEERAAQHDAIRNGRAGPGGIVESKPAIEQPHENGLPIPSAD